MAIFNRGERVRIIELENESRKIYLVKGAKQVQKGGTLYLLKSLEEKPILRLYYESEESLLERIY